MLTNREFWIQLVKDALSSKGEYNDIDFKLDLSGKNDRLKEHINAFGNLERGGCFVFGIDNFKVVGLQQNADDITQKITNLSNNSQQPSLNVDSFTISIDRKQILCLHIMPSVEKPVFIKSRDPMGGVACFKRSGSSTIAMSTQEIRDLLASAQETFFDEAEIQDTDIKDLNFLLLQELIPSLDAKQKDSEKNTAILKDNKIITGHNNNIKITVSGWLCFANNIQEHRQFRNVFIEFQIFKGLTRDTPTKKYEIKGTLPEQLKKSIELLKQNMWYVPKISGAKREDIPAYSEEILREVVTNSLVHRDYKKMHQPVKIAMFDNRVEIENPGGLMPGLTAYNMIHKRDWRNPLLAELMKKFGFGEMDGQGIDRIYSMTLSLKVPPPIFKDNKNSFTAVLSAPKSYEDFSAEEKRLMVIILLLMHDQIDNESVRNCFGISSEKSGTLLKSMVSEKILKASSKSRRHAKYIFTERLHEKIYT